MAVDNGGDLFRCCGWRNVVDCYADIWGLKRDRDECEGDGDEEEEEERERSHCCSFTRELFLGL